MTGRPDLFRALAVLAEPPRQDHRAIAAALELDGTPAPGDHAAVFLFGAYPYASVYLGPEGMLGGEARDRVAGFWRALGLVPPPEPDHISALLALYAALLDGEAEATGRDARAIGPDDDPRRRARVALLWEHLLSWTPPFLAKVADLDAAFYGSWAKLLSASLSAEARASGPPARLPLHLREAPGLPDPDATSGDWLGAVLAPVRSGMVLTRSDLRRGASEMGLGVRAGERAFMLRSLVEQDAAATTAWLAGEAGRAAALHRRSEADLGGVARFWRGRAEASEAVLRRAA